VSLVPAVGLSVLLVVGGMVSTTGLAGELADVDGVVAGTVVVGATVGLKPPGELFPQAVAVKQRAIDRAIF
jgi:hypothetical protein